MRTGAHSLSRYKGTEKNRIFAMFLQNIAQIAQSCAIVQRLHPKTTPAEVRLTTRKNTPKSVPQYKFICTAVQIFSYRGTNFSMLKSRKKIDFKCRLNPLFYGILTILVTFFCENVCTFVGM